MELGIFKFIDVPLAITCFFCIGVMILFLFLKENIDLTSVTDKEKARDLMLKKVGLNCLISVVGLIVPFYWWISNKPKTKKEFYGPLVIGGVMSVARLVFDISNFNKYKFSTAEKGLNMLFNVSTLIFMLVSNLLVIYQSTEKRSEEKYYNTAKHLPKTSPEPSKEEAFGKRQRRRNPPKRRKKKY